MSSKYTEKVICLYCDKILILKNLESHNKSQHVGKKLYYKSAVSKDLSAMYGSVGKQVEENLPGSSTASP